MNLKSLCKETAVLKRKQEKPDDYGQPIFDEPVNVKCLIVDKVKLLITPKGETLVNYSDVLMIDNVNVGDLLNDRPVQIVTSVKDKRGKVLGWEVYLQ